MRIDYISIQGVLGARDVEIRRERPVLLVCGPNAAGKSSILEAVRWALLGEQPRVALKKDASQLVTEGMKRGEIRVSMNGEEWRVSVPGEAQSGALGPIVRFALDGSRFAALDAKARTALLYAITGLSHDQAAVRERLIRRGCDATRVDAVLPVLRAGWDSAEKHAKSKVSEARGAWKATSGEAYGAVKASSWTAPAPGFDAQALAAARVVATTARDAEATAAAKVGALQTTLRTQAEQSAKLEGLRERAGTYARVQDKLNRDEAELATWVTKVEALRVAALAKPHHACPECGTLLVAGGAGLERYEGGTTAPDPDARTRLAEAERAHALYTNAVAAGKRDLAAANAAAEALKAVEESLAPLPSESLDDLRAAHAAAKAALTDAERKARELEDAERAAGAAAAKTETAARYHADAQAWAAIAEALSPEGVPAEMLAEALHPVNERLAYNAAVADWPICGINADMSIEVGGRLYELCSESERWRADAMIAETISHLSGARVLMLDRLDVLDMKGREDALVWLDELATAGAVETAIVAGTLRAAPSGLPETIQTVWITNGRAVREREKAAA